MPFSFNSKEEAVNYNNISHSGCLSTKAGWEKRSYISDDAIEKCSHPSYCVDYLTHNWTDEDLAHSWRLVTRQHNSTDNCTRLENASWRIWNKRRNNIPTLDPKEINWHKDNDTSWLYGPLLSIPEPKLTSQKCCLESNSSKQPNPIVLTNTSKLKPALKKHTLKDTIFTIECSTRRPKIRFNNLVEQMNVTNSNVLDDKPTVAKSSFVRIKPIIEIPKIEIEESYYFDNYLSYTVPRYIRSPTSPNNMYLENYEVTKQDPSFPIIQSCFNAVNSTVSVLSWAKKMIL